MTIVCAGVDGVLGRLEGSVGCKSRALPLRVLASQEANQVTPH